MNSTNTYKRNKTRLFKTFVICLFLVSAVFIQVTPNKAFAQSKEIDSKLAQIEATMNKMEKIQDSSATKQDKEKSETELKKEILLSIIDLGKLQIKEVKEKLSDIKFPDTSDWNAIKDSFYSKLGGYNTYYNSMNKDIENNKDITLNDIRDIAKKIDTKKTGEIDIYLQNMNSIITTFNISDILSVADDRLKKINEDLTKIYAQKITKKDTLKDMFSKASLDLGEAHSFNNKAKDVILNFYSITIPTSTTTSSTSSTTASTTITGTTGNNEQLSASTSTATSTVTDRKIQFIKSLVDEMTDKQKIQMGIATSSTSTTSYSTSTQNEPKPADKTFTNKSENKNASNAIVENQITTEKYSQDIIEKYIRYMVLETLGKIKSTYDIFIEMSTKAENLLNK